MSVLAKGLRMNFVSLRFKLPTISSFHTSVCHASSDPPATLDSATKDRFDKLVKNNKVVLFMKGVPEEPKCGFSNAVVQIFRMHGVDGYDAHDVLKDEAIRNGVKEYSNWPTIPQIYINGEFIGGCDIVIQMHQNGELIDTLQKVGIKSALVDSQPKK